MKTFKITVTEGELIALIYHHSRIIQNSIEDNTDTPITMGEFIKTSERIHNLTKRLNKDTPKIEGAIEPSQATAAKDEQQTGW